MKIKIVEKFKSKDFDLEIILVNKIEDLGENKDLLESLDFKIKDESSIFLPESKKIYSAFEEFNYDSIAIAIATAIKKATSTKFKTVKLVLNNFLEDNFKALVEGAILGAYKFENYKSEKNKNDLELNFVVEKKSSKLSDVLEESKIIASSVN